MKADVLRKKFLDFFASKDHKIISSDSLVPKDDPTLLFTTAGMNQFKKQFLGNTGDFRRAVTCQKCLRTDDLDKVGKTAAHHTFFEMLGNFSFGDYFKDEAIAWAWEFLTAVLELPKDKLWASVYYEDKEAYDIWLNKIKLPSERIVKLGDKENFWPSEAKAKGPNGPCGPCSEIFYDYGKKIGCGKTDCNPACDCGRFVEVWNLVFTQFIRKDVGILEVLPNKNIDTGMGLERLAAVIQDVYNNFDTDLFIPIINSIKKELGITESNESQIIKIRIIADHIRAITFAIFDGVNPSNEERGYVVRKLIRIGVDNYRDLEIKKPVLYKIVSAVSETMQESYPQLVLRREDIAEIIRREEESYLKIIKELAPVAIAELKELEKRISDVEQRSIETGRIAFKFHDTFGFSFSTTASTIAINKVQVDLGVVKSVFDQSMKEQADRSRAASAMGGDVFVDSALKLNLGDTEFKGYDNIEVSAKILKMFDVNNRQINSSEGQTDVKIILDKTPFYGESGGQVGDVGFIERDANRLEVIDTKRADGVFIHIAKVKSGIFKVNDEVKTKVDYKNRLDIARNHTATHLLQAALRKVLGQHVQQQGSLVAADRLRFDFTHFKGLSKQELDRIEGVVNELIRGNTNVDIKEATLDEAKKSGALAFFAERYKENVRVVSVGDYSKELCGGTHLTSTGQIGLLKIIDESSVAQGVRRIEAVTGEVAYKKIKAEEGLVFEVSQLLKVPAEKIIEQVRKIVQHEKELEKKQSTLRLQLFSSSVNEIIQTAKEYNGIKIITQNIKDADMELLRSISDLLKTNLKSGVIALGSIYDAKVNLVMAVTSDLTKKNLDASRLIKKVAKMIGGSGGGRPEFAQAGGVEVDKLDSALNKVMEIMKEDLK